MTTYLEFPWSYTHIAYSHIAYSLYNFYGATMTIKGSLQMKILYRGVFAENFLSSVFAQISTLGDFSGVKY